jgi:hypothetical protein
MEVWFILGMNCILNIIHMNFVLQQIKSSPSCSLLRPIPVDWITSHLVRFQVLTAASMKFRVFWDVGRVVTLKLTDVSEVSTDFIALMMEAIRISETSVNFNVTTWHYIPGDSKLHTSHIYYHLWRFAFSHSRLESSQNYQS